MTRQILETSLRSLYGKPCWGVRHDRQLNLSMNFGTPLLDIREPYVTNFASETAKGVASRRNVTIRGEWWLWIYCSYWRLTSDERRLATGSSSARQIERAIKELDGQKLVSAVVNPETGATRFVFDLGCVLDCRRFERNSDKELWMLYKPSGYVLSVHGNGAVSHERGNAML
jgi:hypothetical protein